METAARISVYVVFLIATALGQKEIGDIEEGCPAGSYSFGSHCYSLFTLSGSYEDSELACEGRGGILAAIKDPETHIFVQKLRIRKHLLNYWIGLNDRQKEGQWVYSDGSRMQGFNRWLPGEPNNAQKTQDCAHMWMLKNLLWDDQRCDKRNLYVCQFEARNCSVNATQFGAYCLELSRELATYDEADHICTARGGILAAVKTQAMHELLKLMIYSERWWKDMSEQEVSQFFRDDKNGVPNCWIGIRYVQGAWVYSDGTFVTSNFSRWAPGEPNNAKSQEDCVMGGQDWYDVVCSNVRPFICQYDRISSKSSPPLCPAYDVNPTTNESQSENATSSPSRSRSTMPMRVYRVTTKSPEFVVEKLVDDYTGVRLGKIEFAFLIFGCFVFGTLCSMLIFGLVFYKSNFLSHRRERLKDDGQDIAILENEVINPMHYVQNPAQDDH